MIFNKIISEIQTVLDSANQKDFEILVKSISKSKRIFLCASGRSELILEAFAMRLAQMDLNVYIMGEADTPKIKRGNLLICVSGSGSTKATLDIIKDSKKLGAKIITISSKKVSPIGKLSKKVIEIKAKTKTGGKSIEPMGSLFEQSVLIYLDSIVLSLMKKLHKSEGFLKKRHSKIR